MAGPAVVSRQDGRMTDGQGTPVKIMLETAGGRGEKPALFNTRGMESPVELPAGRPAGLSLLNLNGNGSRMLSPEMTNPP